MRKQELIHLHGLFAELALFCRTDIDVDLTDYHATGVQPTSIHRSKTAHKEAVFALADGLTADLKPAQATERVPVQHPSSAD